MKSPSYQANLVDGYYWGQRGYTILEDDKWEPIPNEWQFIKEGFERVKNAQKLQK